MVFRYFFCNVLFFLLIFIQFVRIYSYTLPIFSKSSHDDYNKNENKESFAKYHVVRHAFNPSTQDAEAGGSYNLQTNLVYRASSRPARAVIILPQTKQTKSHLPWFSCEATTITGSQDIKIDIAAWKDFHYSLKNFPQGFWHTWVGYLVFGQGFLLLLDV